MTFLAVIMIVLTLMGIITGVFGMNFTQIEVHARRNGFALPIWGVLSLGAMLAAFFNFRKWW